MDKERGLENYENIRTNASRNTKESRSANMYGKIDKARGLRRIADRHGHHRRRIIMSIELNRCKKVPSMSCAKHRKGLCASMWISERCKNDGSPVSFQKRSTSQMNQQISSDTYAASTTAPTLKLAFDLEGFFQGSATPVNESGRVFYYLVRQHMSWQAFLDLCDQRIEGLEGWKACRACVHFWDDVSCISDADGRAVFLGQDPDDYPEEVRPAVRAYQRSFSKAAVRDQVLFCPSAERHQVPDLGRESLGICKTTGRAYHHIYLKTNLNTLPSDELNAIFHQELPLLERLLTEWNPAVVKVILSRYETRGQDAPGYKVNYLGLRFLNQLQTELSSIKSLRESAGRLITFKHLIRLTSGARPHDALGGIHIFANGSNLAACRDAGSEEAFWKILQERYNPALYRQPTAAPTEGQIKAALSLVGGDTTCFEREFISVHDPRVTQRAFWCEIPETPTDATRISALDLLSHAVKKASISSAPPTCFDKATTSTSTNRKFTVMEFEEYLGTAVAPGVTLEWFVSPRVCPVQVAVPVTEKGLDMIKRDASWAVPTLPMSPAEIGIHGSWVRVPLVVPHASRWRKPCDGGGVFGHEAALVSSGLILQVPHTWEPPCSCLFAEFFTGDMHALGAVRQELHRSLRMRKPDLLEVRDIFRGILLTVFLLPGHDGRLTAQMRQPETFRISCNGKTQLLTVQ